MKTSVFLSLFMLALASIGGIATEIRLAQLQAQSQACRLSPYSCSAPTITFASLR